MKKLEKRRARYRRERIQLRSRNRRVRRKAWKSMGAPFVGLFDNYMANNVYEGTRLEKK